MLRKIIFPVLLLAYGALFALQEHQFIQREPQLNLPLPIAVQKTVLGFLRQFGGEAHFITTSVFLGGLEPSKPMDAYANSLTEHFKSMAALHPHFIDTYFLCESGLAHISSQQARDTNAVLSIGMDAHPDYWYLPFFKGFNHFYYLDENRKAADELLKAANLPDGPPWLAHLASMLAAEGGDIITGLAWLKTMLKTEADISVRERYENEVIAFEQALMVQNAIKQYEIKYGAVPNTLETLVPEFLDVLPNFNPKFKLIWQPPRLSMQRTNTKHMRMK